MKKYDILYICQQSNIYCTVKYDLTYEEAKKVRKQLLKDLKTKSFWSRSSYIIKEKHKGFMACKITI